MVFNYQDLFISRTDSVYIYVLIEYLIKRKSEIEGNVGTMIYELITIYTRDLEKLKNEIAAFKSEKNIWKTVGNTSNSAGNLVLHLTGNLNHYIGNVLGDSGYVRNRSAEFTTREIPAEKLLSGIDEVSDVVIRRLKNLNEEDLSADFPEEVFGTTVKTSFMLIHLTTHLSYHTGQVNYIRRVLE